MRMSPASSVTVWCCLPAALMKEMKGLKDRGNLLFASVCCCLKLVRLSLEYHVALDVAREKRAA